MNFLLEIGTEELPAGDVWTALGQLQAKAPYILRSLEIGVDRKMNIYGTPRRLVVYLEDLTGTEIRPTMLGEASLSLIKSLKFEKSMRWLPNSKLSFSRPIRWLLALLDDQLVEIEFAGVRSEAASYGPRFLSSPVIRIPSASGYFDQLKNHHIIVDQEERRQMILEQSQQLAREVKGVVYKDEALLNEVVQLVEYPTCVRGGFSGRYLNIPREVAITVMRAHQRYFPVVDSDEALLPYFITVANHLDNHKAVIRRGNEKVVEARLSDGEFFYQQDRKHQLEHFLPDLKTIVFHEKLGSVYEKTERLEKMTPFLSELFGLAKPDQEALGRAAYLCKADLATALVREFTSLQGTIGKVYAEADGEDPRVAKAIYEHHLPRFSGDELPGSSVGRVLAVSDRIDTLVAFFAVGLQPTGSQDPYALRRAALGLIQILVLMGCSIKLRELFKLANQFIPADLGEDKLTKLVQFIQERIKGDLKDTGVRSDVIKAVLAGSYAEDVYLTYQVVREVSERIDDEPFRKFVTAANRVGNIVRDVTVIGDVDPQLFEEKAEKELFQAYWKVQDTMGKTDASDVSIIMSAYYDLTNPINKFFEDVLVMTDAKPLRENRLRLMRDISLLTHRLFQPQDLLI